MARLGFYLLYAWRNIRRGGRWTFLAILCIAAGVATVVALRSLGLAIQESLVSNVREDIKGDVLMFKGNGSQIGITFSPDSQATFSPREIDRIQDYVQARDGRIDTFIAGGNLSIAAVDAVSVGRPQFIGTYFINPDTYPLTHAITAVDPAGVPLGDLLTTPTDIVVSNNMAQQQHLSVGDTVRVGGQEEPYTISGIVDAGEEASFSDIFNAFFGFVYLNQAAADDILGDDSGVNRISIVFDEMLPRETIDNIVEELVDRGSDSGSFANYDTAYAQLERNQVIAQFLGDFIVVMGLGALLIGGVGIMNTMLVMVRRRTNEIAALKTFGLKSRQIINLFLMEGLLLGIAGSVIGSVVGVLLGGIVNQYGETFLQQRLVWRIHPEALLYGLVLGLLITAIFGVAPILTALRIRPGIILRPNESHAPRLGILQALGMMILVVIAIGLIAGQIISSSYGLAVSYAEPGTWSPLVPYLVGVVGVAVTLALLGILVLVLWVIVWLVGKLPSFGSVDLRLALRNLSTHRLRTATTLLALSAGMFALSSITFVGQGTRELLNIQLSRTFGGNVLVFPLSPGGFGNAIGNTAINAALRNVDGIEARTVIMPANFQLVAIDGRQLETITMPARNFMNGDAPDDDFGGPDFDNFDSIGSARASWQNITILDTNSNAVYEQIAPAVQGRQLTIDDRGQQVVVGPQEAAQILGFGVGSTLTYDIDGDLMQFEVVGLTAASVAGFATGGASMPPEAVSSNLFPFRIYSFQIDEANVNEALLVLSSIRIPPTFALDVKFIDSLISRLIDQFAAIPTVVGGLSLLAAAVIMANTVALATLERRRQIGILKSVGLKSRRVLRIMLIEAVMVSLLSAVLGVGLSMLFVTLFTSATGTAIPLPADARLTAVFLLVAAVFIGWLATYLSANIAARERVMNVLRYE